MSSYRSRYRELDAYISHLHFLGGTNWGGWSANPFAPNICSGGINIGSGLIVYVGTRSAEGMQDYSDPDVRAYHPVVHDKISLGVTQCHFTVVYYTSETANFSLDLSYSYYDGYGFDVPWAPLVNDLASQITSQLQSNSLLLVTLAELGKTIRMVKNPLGFVKQSNRHPRRLSDKAYRRYHYQQMAQHMSAAQLAKYGSSMWLEGQYGWKSAYADIKNFCDSFRKFEKASNDADLGEVSTRFSKSSVFQDRAAFTSGVSEANWSTMMEHPNGFYSSGSGNIFAWQAQASERRCVATVGCKRYLEAQNKASKLQLALQAVGATSRSLLPTLWELTPWSFVLDWFVDTQGILSLPSSVAILHSSSCRELGYSLKAESNIGLRVIPAGAVPTATTGYGPPTVINRSSSIVSAASFKHYERTLGLPNLSLTQFLDQNGLSGIQKTNGIGLIIQKVVR